MAEPRSIPFHVLQEDDLWILVHKDRPSWLVTNEVGKDIAVRNALGYSEAGVAEYLRGRYGPNENVEGDISGFLQQLGKTGLTKEPSDPCCDACNRLEAVLLLITGACNLACRHCSVGGSPTTIDFPEDYFYRLIDQLVSLQTGSLILSGGEPLLRSDLFELIAYASQNLHVTLSTNGTLIGREEARRLKEASIGRIAISLDGTSARTHDFMRGKGSFDKTRKGIDFLVDAGLGDAMDLQFCLSSHNLDEALDIPAFAASMGFRKVTYLSIRKLGNASHSWEDLAPDRVRLGEFFLKLYDTFLGEGFPIEANSPLSGFRPTISPGGEPVTTCPFGANLIVGTTGDIYPCPAMLIPDYCLGNAFEMRMQDVLTSAKFQGMRNDRKAREERIAKCRECTWRSFCKAGCASAVFTEKGTIWETDDLCDIRDKLYRKTILHVARRKTLESQGAAGSPG